MNEKKEKSLKACDLINYKILVIDIFISYGICTNYVQIVQLILSHSYSSFFVGFVIIKIKNAHLASLKYSSQ